MVGRCKVKYLPKGEGREGGEKIAHKVPARTETRTQDLLRNTMYDVFWRLLCCKILYDFVGLGLEAPSNIYKLDKKYLNTVCDQSQWDVGHIISSYP